MGHAQLELLGLPLAAMVHESLQTSAQAGGGARSMAADDAAGLVRAHAAAIAACLRALAAPGPEPPLLSYDEQTHRFGPAASGAAALSRAPLRVLPRYSASHGAAPPACAAAAPPPPSTAVLAPPSLAGGVPAHAAGASAMPPPASCLPVPTMSRLTSPAAGLAPAAPPADAFAAAPPSCFGAGAAPAPPTMGLITPAQLAASSAPPAHTAAAPAAHTAAAPPAHMPSPSLRVLDHPFAPRPATAGLAVEADPPLPAFFGRVLSQPGSLHALEALEPPAAPHAPPAPHAAVAAQPSPEELLSRSNPDPDPNPDPNPDPDPNPNPSPSPSPNPNANPNLRQELLSRVASLNETSKQAMLGLLPAEHPAEPGFALPPLPGAAPAASWSTWGAFPSAFPSPLDTPSWAGAGMPAPAPAAAPSAAPIFQT